MAVYYFRNTGDTNWGTASNWSLTDGGGATGAVPTAADDAYFTSNSGNCTVNAVSRDCKTLIFSGVGAGNYSGTITVSFTLSVFGNVTLSSTMTIGGGGDLRVNTTGTLTSNGKTWPYRLIVSGTSQTYTLADNWVINGNILFSGATSSVINQTTTQTLTVNGNLTIQTTGLAVSGTATIILGGTGTWSHSGNNSLRNNLIINTAGTITILGNVYYNTGTLTYTAGTVVTTGSTLNIAASTTLSTGTIAWNNLSITASATITLGANLVVTNTFTVSSGFTVTITPGIYSVNFSTANVNIGVLSSTSTTFTYNGTITCVNFQAVAGNTYTNTLNGTTFNITGNFTLTNTGAGGGSLTGTSSLNFTGTGTIQQTNSTINAIPITNNITINTSGIITFPSGTFLYYQTGTFTYTAGTVVTTNFGFYCTNGCTLNTNGISWNTVFFGGTSQTFTLTSNLNMTGTLTLAGATSSVVNGNTMNIGGGLTISSTAAMSGTTNMIMNGTGTINTGSASIANNLTINTLGTITITALQYRTNTLTYIAGTITANPSLIISGSCTINTPGISWGSLTISATSTITLSSNFTVLNTVSISGLVALTITPSGNNIDFSSANMSLATIASLTCNGTITCNNLQLTAGNTYNQTLNGTTLNIRGDLTVVSAGGGGGSVIGTSTLVLVGTGTISTAAAITNNMVINSNGRITLQGTIFYQTGTFTYLSGTIISKNSTFYLLSACTLINCHRIPFNIVTITAGVTITMNQFFSGSPSIKTRVQSSTTANYTIAFQDGFEKVAKFVNVNNATFTRPNQLVILTRMPMKTTNVGGIRYINQSPNGVAKNNSSVTDPMTYPAMGLVQDPNLII